MGNNCCSRENRKVTSWSSSSSTSTSQKTTNLTGGGSSTQVLSCTSSSTAVLEETEEKGSKSKESGSRSKELGSRSKDSKSKSKESAAKSKEKGSTTSSLKEWRHNISCRLSPKQTSKGFFLSTSKSKSKNMSHLKVRSSPELCPGRKRGSAESAEGTLSGSSSASMSKTSKDSVCDDVEKLTITGATQYNNNIRGGHIHSLSAEGISSVALTPDSGGSGTSPSDHGQLRVHFTFDSGSESDHEGESRSKPKRSSMPSHSQSMIVSKKHRFTKILRPLRRSHSAGCTKDVPPHALFLRHDIEHETKQRKQSEQREKRESVVTSPIEKLSPGGSDDERRETHQQHTASGSKKRRNLGKEMKQKLRFLRRRHTDTALGAKAAKLKEGEKSKPCLQDILDWSKGFDNLLHHKYGLNLFREFLRTEFSEENIEFWIVCEEYSSLKPSKMSERAQEIYNDFVAVQAPREVNLDSKTREITGDNIDKPNKHTFEQAQKKVQALMEKDSYPRFLRSDVYMQLLAEHGS
ncbi:regulator of G-protein signaling 3-like isoform X2 [Lineus longissimus]|uniref:regulator of G-protein signaling 3-like isoform X2 n=1 Tax=Lineus longissimus TaxID=88925 RepID=UPI00315D62E0